MLQITASLCIDDKDLSYEFIRASGPGGQNVNKVATAVQLRYDVRKSSALTEETKTRLIIFAGHRMTQAGVLVIEAKRYRSQEKNRLDAEQRLVALVHKALILPKHRHPTRPGKAAQARRIDPKKRRGSIKQLRRSSRTPEE
jgi:ribosome-associated protein